MRLHTLSLEAFGPFPERVDVDFDELDQGILLVNGPTGSGKSSLLDAVTFALFGDVAGSRRAVRSALRSHHAAPDTAPWVELEFSVGPARWKVHRTPAWDAPKRRGSGTTPRPASVLLSQWRDGQWHFVSSRIDESADMVTDTLGMGLEQFAQVVLLPQGEFAQFLRARPEDRRALLERLFDVARFDAVERWFTETKNDRLRATDASLERIRGHMTVVSDTLARLDDADLPEVEWTEESVASLPDQLRELLAAVRARLAETDEVAEREARAAKSAERVVDRAAALLGLRATFARAQDDLDAWPAANVEAMRRDAEAADHVAGVLRLAQRDERAQAQLEQARARRSASAATLSDLTGVEALTEESDVDEVLPPQHLARQVSAVHALQAQLPRHARSLDEMAGATAAVASARRRLATAETTLKQATDELEKTEGAFVAASDSLSAVPDVSARLDAVKVAIRLVAEAPGHRAASEQAAVHRNEATRAFAEREHEVVRLRTARLAGMSAEIAADLEDGHPCPVCGSCEHPSPATASPEAPDAAQIEAAEKAARRADDVRRRRESALAAAEQAWQSHLAHLQTRLDECVMPAPGQDDAAPLSAQRLVEDDAPLRDLEQQLVTRRQRRERAASALEGATHARDRAARAVTAAEKDVAATTAQRDSAEERLAAARAGLDDSRRAVDEAFDHVTADSTPTLLSLPRWTPNSDELDPQHERTRVDDALADVERARDRLSEIERARAAYVRAHDTFRSALTQSETSAAELADELVAKGYDDLDAARAVALDDDELTALRATWQHAIEVRAAASAALRDEDVVAAAYTPAAEPSRLRRRADILARRANDSASEAARWHQGYSVLSSMRDATADAVHAHLPLAEAAKEMSDLASTFGGTGENSRRMRLTSYVLAAHLETVTAMANERLHRMTDGRYQLKYTDERAKGNQKSGLGLLVVDAWTGRSRETATLSGGEAFMASLALALGLGDAVRADSGGMELHTLFVDEGFGSLDQDTLEQVMEVLDGLREGGRLVGVVSHVTELRARIPSQIEVRKTSEGSSVRTKVASGLPVSAPV